MPGACKRLACLSGFGCVSGGVHALGAELDSAPLDPLSIAEPDAAVRADEHRPEDKLGSQGGVGVAHAALPCRKEGERDRHCFFLVVCFDLLGVACNQVILRANAQGFPLKVLCKPAECLDCRATGCAVDGPVLFFAGEGCVEKIHEQGHRDMLKWQALGLHEVQEGLRACEVAEQGIHRECGEQALDMLLWMCGSCKNAVQGAMGSHKEHDVAELLDKLLPP